MDLLSRFRTKEDEQTILKEIRNGDYDLRYANRDGNSLLHACRYGYSDIAIALINEFHIDSSYVNRRKETALIWACRRSMEKVALFLLKNDCNFDQVTSGGESALICACREGLISVMLELKDQYLLKNPIGIAQIDNQGNTALTCLCRNGYDNWAMDLIGTGYSQPKRYRKGRDTALMIALRRYDCYSTVHLLLDRNESHLEHIGFNDETALILAFQKGYESIILKLIKAEPYYGIQMVNQLYEMGMLETISFLLETGMIDINMFDKRKLMRLKILYARSTASMFRLTKFYFIANKEFYPKFYALYPGEIKTTIANLLTL